MPEKIPAVFEVLDDRFAGTGGDRLVERVFDDGRWLEGPAYSPAGGFVLFSDIPNDRVLRYDELTGRTDVVRSPADFPNGRTLDPQGRFVTCEHGARRVTRLEHDGTVTVLADSWQGMRLNSPNDVVVHSDGSVWFTDPSYGIHTDYEGHAGQSEIGARHVFRLDPTGRSLEVVAADFVQPNGLAFTPDERRLVVVDSDQHTLRFFDVDETGLRAGEVFASDELGYDGVRFDDAGRLWAAAQDGLHCYHPDGTLLGKLLIPEIVANLTFGGPQRNQLYLTATTSLYTLRVNFRGACYPVAR